MKLQLKALSIALGAATLMAGSAWGESTVGVQTTGATSASAKMTVTVTVPKIVVLKVGPSGTGMQNVVFGVDLNPSLGTGNSMAYTWAGTAAPSLSITPVSSTVSVAAWTNTGNATVDCALSSLGGATAFAAGPTALGVPGTDDITVLATLGAGTGSVLPHPSSNLSGCGSPTASLNANTLYNSEYLFGTAFTASLLLAGTYGNTVTYTATSL